MSAYSDTPLFLALYNERAMWRSLYGVLQHTCPCGWTTITCGSLHIGWRCRYCAGPMHLVSVIDHSAPPTAFAAVAAPSGETP